MGSPSSHRHPLSWLILGAITLLQAISGTRFVFSTCSSLMIKHYGISYVQLNNLIVALEIGRLFGWFSNAAVKHLPAWLILLTGLILGSVGYGVQYLCITEYIPSLSYWQILVLNFLAGISIFYINTYCKSVACRNFKNEHHTITALTSSYSWLTGKVYTFLVEAIQGKKDSQSSATYLLLSCLAPTIVGLAVALSNSFLELTEHGEIGTFPVVFAIAIAIATGIYSVLERVVPLLKHMSPILRAVNFLLVLMLPIAAALLMGARQLTLAKWRPQVMPEVFSESNSNRITEELDITIADEREGSTKAETNGVRDTKESTRLGDEHRPKEPLKRLDFWLFYIVNACGPTLGIVYLNNLMRITESHGNCGASVLLALSSTFGFLGRIFLVIFSWYTRETSIISEEALTVFLMIPMPVAFFMLISNSNMCLYISTGILGTCSGAITAITASTISKLFGTQNLVANETVVFTNIPMGSLLFGYLAAHNYEREGGGDQEICMGQKCHHRTFIIWGSVCTVGTILSFFMHLRTRRFYSHKS